MRAGPGQHPYPPLVTLPLEPAAAPAAFAAAVQQLRGVLGGPLRRGLALREVPAPRRMAPWSYAVAAEVERDGGDVASGRFVVLHDPAGQDGWGGDTRVVAFVEAQVEAEMAADPALADVGWSWLLEALDERGAARTAEAGTVTRTASRRFGRLDQADALRATDDATDSRTDRADDSEVEVRASWSPLAGPDGLELAPHLLAWCDLLCSTAGLPPDGVAALRRR